MKKYQWNDAELQKKAKLYAWLTMGLSVIALIVYFLFSDASVWALGVLLIGVVACYGLGGRVLAKDKQLKPKE